MDLKINKLRYVVFDNEGNIIKIVKRITEDENALEVQYDDVRNLLEGKRSLSSYIVEYDFIDKKHFLKDKRQQLEDLNVSSFLYELPNECDDPQVKIVQDTMNSCWKLEFNQSLLNDSKQNHLQLDPKNHYYSVTKRGDPNILYKLLKFDDSMQIGFETEEEFDETNFSVYTTRKFDTYKYEVI